MLHCENLTVRYGGVAALDGLSLDVPQRGMTAVMGESGSGKTTLLRAIAGLVEPAAGTVSWEGLDLTHTPPHRRRFGLMFQDYALFPHLSVAANVAFGVRMQGATPREASAAVDRMLGLVGLEGYDARSVDELSGGEQQRVALARTLAPGPDLVLLDEPLGALDRARRDQLLADMQRIFRDVEVTALYVTHDHHEAFTIGDDVVVLDAGRRIARGSPRQLWDAPGHPVVATLLGFPILHGVAVERGMARIAGAAVVVPLADGTYDLAVPPDAIQLGSGGHGDVPVVARRFVDGAERAAILIDGVEVLATPGPGTGGLYVDGSRLRPVTR